MSLNGRSYGLLALICLAGILAQWAEGGFLAWRAALAGLILGLTYEFVAVRRITLQAVVDKPLTVRLGRDTNFELQVIHNAARPLPVQFSPGLPASLSCNRDVRQAILASGDGINFKVLGLNLGKWHWQKIPCQCRGPLGLAWWRRDIPVDQSIRIRPDVFTGRADTAGQRPMGHRAHVQGAGAELHHLREYVPGDPRHTIDWKATARTDKLTTKVFAAEQNLEVVIVLDIGRTSRTHIGELDQFSHYINLASRFAQHAMTSGDKVGLLAMADTLQSWVAPGTGRSGLQRVNDALSELQPSAEEANLLAAAAHLQHRVQHRCLIVVLTDLYGNALDGALGQSVRLWRTHHLPMLVSLLDPAILHLSQRQANSRRDVYMNLAGAEYRDVIDSNRLAATRLGAQCIIAQPDHLERKVFALYAELKSRRRV